MPPVEVRATDWPKQMVEGVEDAVGVGRGFTVIVTCAVEVHPPESPVTVYVVVADGLTITLVPVSEPGIHVYVVAPAAVSVVELPLQIVEADADTVTVGVMTTVTVTCAVEVQPPRSPVTVYVVVTAGETLTTVPDKEPGIQLYVDAPLPVSVVLFPEQIVGDEAVADTVGVGFTVTVTWLVEEQEPVVPVTVYVVVDAGDTVTVVPLNAPGFHV
jgi:hypothetical protein